MPWERWRCRARASAALRAPRPSRSLEYPPRATRRRRIRPASSWRRGPPGAPPSPCTGAAAMPCLSLLWTTTTWCWTACATRSRESSRPARAPGAVDGPPLAASARAPVLQEAQAPLSGLHPGAARAGGGAGVGTEARGALAALGLRVGQAQLGGEVRLLALADESAAGAAGARLLRDDEGHVRRPPVRSAARRAPPSGPRATPPASTRGAGRGVRPPVSSSGAPGARPPPGADGAAGGGGAPRRRLRARPRPAPRRCRPRAARPRSPPLAWPPGRGRAPWLPRPSPPPNPPPRSPPPSSPPACALERRASAPTGWAPPGARRRARCPGAGAPPAARTRGRGYVPARPSPG